MKRVAAIALTLSLTVTASAQIGPPSTQGVAPPLYQQFPPIGAGSDVPIGPSVLSSGTNVTPPVGCNAGQLDWSDATGCNLVFAGH